MGKKNFQNLEKCVNKLVADGEKIVVLRYNKKTKCVDFRGSPEMKNFGMGTLETFLSEICRPEKPPKAIVPVGLPALQPDNINLTNLRKIVSSLVSTSVFNQYGIKRGYWGIPSLAPDWYPETVNFLSPNDNKSKNRLTKEDCEKVLKSYKQFVMSGNSSHKGESISSSFKPQKRHADAKEEEAADTKKMKLELPKMKEGVDELPKVKECVDLTEIPTPSNEITEKKIKPRGITTKDVSLTLLRTLSRMNHCDIMKLSQTLLKAILPPDHETSTDILSAVEEKRFTPPKGFLAYASLQQGDCFFSSLSQLTYGSNEGKALLRLGSGLFGLCYVNDFVEKFIAEGINAYQFLLEVARDEVIGSLQEIQDERELIKQVLLAEAQQSLRPSSYSGFLQVLFAAGFLQRNIKQYQEKTACTLANLYTTMVHAYPKWVAAEKEALYVMWVRTGGSNVPNHVVPLRKVSRGRRLVATPWSWVKLPRNPPNLCKASTVGWCVCGTEMQMLECSNCNEMSHPQCFGISRHFFQDNGSGKDIGFMCCGEAENIPNVVIAQSSFVSLHLADVLTLQPGKCLTNWVIDFFIYTSTSHKSADYGYLPTTAWEVALKSNINQVRRHRKIWRDIIQKPVVLFVVSESGHFLTGAFLQKSKELVFLDSMKQSRKVYMSHSRKLKRLLGMEDSYIQVHCEETQQQTNGVDCGIHTIINLQNLMKIFQKGTGEGNWRENLGKMENVNIAAFRKAMKQQFLQQQ